MDDDSSLSMSEWFANMQSKFDNLMASMSDESRNEVVEGLFNNFLDEVILGVVFDVHKSVRMNCSAEHGVSDEDIKTYSIIESNDGDIFGQQFVKKSSICRCPRCQRPLSASVFTTHLQNCVGKGRSSARIASLRIANNCIRNAYGGMSDEDDDDWLSGSEKSKKKKPIESKKSQDKNSLRKGKNQNKKKSNKDVIHSENNEEL